MRSLKNLGVTILFTGALLALGFTSLQPLFRAARVDALDSSKVVCVKFSKKKVG